MLQSTRSLVSKVEDSAYNLNSRYKYAFLKIRFTDPKWNYEGINDILHSFKVQIQLRKYWGFACKYCTLSAHITCPHDCTFTQIARIYWIKQERRRSRGFSVYTVRFQKETSMTAHSSFFFFLSSFFFLSPYTFHLSLVRNNF